MSWLDRLTRAKWRDFEFLTESHESREGRRLVAHEYPGADEPEVEDFGLKAKSFRLNAYFIGPDYDKEANGFMAKLVKPGADWLQHPWLGDLWVRAQDWSRSESNDKGGYCTISIEFVQGGRQPYEPKVDKVDVAFMRVRAMQTAVIEDFSLQPATSGEMTALVADVQQHLEGLRAAISLASLPLQWANQAINVVQGIKNDVGTLLQLPQQYANALGTLTDLLGSGADMFNLDVSGSTRARAVTRMTATAINPPAINASPVVSNAQRTNVAFEAALRSNLMIVAAAQIGLADYQDADTRDAVLYKVIGAIDAQLPDMRDEVFEAAAAARSAMIDALMDQDLAAASSRDILNSIPAVVLAYQMGVDEDTFIARNGVRNPLFVQGRVYG